MTGEVTGRVGRLDILINDAAYNKSIPFADLDNLTMEVWDKIMAVNLTGPMRLTKAVAPVMKAQGHGRIVNIASVAGGGPTGSSIAYAVSKAGLIHLTKCMAVALAPETLVNCVAPGPIYTPRMWTGQMTPAGREARRKASVLGLEGVGWDIGHAVRFLLSAQARYITGQTLVVDGGATLVGPSRTPESQR